MSSPQRVSNSDFQAGGIYPGGTGIVKDIAYKLWDYNGTQPPNSQTCVEAIFSPIRQVQRGKDVAINWNVAKADSHAPDPSNSGFCLDLKGTGAKLSDSSNWHFAFEEGFVKNCGIPKDALDGPNGIKALIGSELTLTRMDPPKRDLPNAAPAAPGQPPKRVNQILIPTRAKWAWERGGARQTDTATGTSATPNAAASNGAGAGGDLASLMLSIVTKEGGAIDMADFTAKLTAELTLAGIKGKDRVNLLKSSKTAASLTSAAAANNLLLEQLAIAADGAMSGTLSVQ